MAGFGLFDDVGDDGLGGYDHGGEAGGVFDGGAGDFGGVDDSALEEVSIVACFGVVAPIAVVGEGF